MNFERHTGSLSVHVALTDKGTLQPCANDVSETYGHAWLHSAVLCVLLGRRLLIHWYMRLSVVSTWTMPSKSHKTTNMFTHFCQNLQLLVYKTTT